MNKLVFLSGLNLPSEAARQHDSAEILDFNEKTAARGLKFTPAQALEIADCRVNSLRLNSRVEVGIGAAGKLIKTFSASTFVSPEYWAELICELTELFYFAKTETHDKISDDRLIAFMFDEFENFCGGSTELLAERCDWLTRTINGGVSEDFRRESYDE